MGIRSTWSKGLKLSLVVAMALPIMLYGAGCGGGGSQGESSPQNNVPFPPFNASTQFSGAATGLPNGTPTLPQLLRGRYIVTSAGCTDCHSVTGDDPNSALYMAGAVVNNPTLNPENIGVFPGGDENFGAFTSFSSNDTMDTTGIVFHSPLELFLGLRTGQHHHNAGLMCEPMPWNFFTHMTDDDDWAVVAYLRSLLPVANFVPIDVGADGLTSLGQQYCNSFPEPVNTLPNYPGANEIPVTNTLGPGVPTGPATLQQVLNGRYLVTAICACGGCHSHNIDNPSDPDWLAGFVADPNVNPHGIGDFQVGPIDIKAPNLTPDATGLASFSAQDIFNVLRLGKDPQGNTVCPPMPWPDFRNLADSDIWSIVAYLQSLKPVHNVVPDETFLANGQPVPPNFCAIFFPPPPAPQAPFPLPAYPASHEINPQFTTP